MKQRSSGVCFFLLVFFALPLSFARVAAVQPPFAVTSAGLGCRQGLHVQDLVDLSEGEQPQGLLPMEGVREKGISLAGCMFD